MKFQKLTIHNIASIEDAVIDFEAQPLADSEVFLITGKTGAGKSTILDAICLALYADTPRLDGTKMQGNTKDGDKSVQIDDPRQLMRRNTGEASVSLTFTGSNGVHYESKWSVARARKKATGNMQPKEWQLKNLDTEQTLTKDREIEAEIHTAIGLDFNQFCRTTMLAQGEFTRFLNSKDDEKAEILEKITGVDVYSKIGAKVYEVTEQKKQIWNDAQHLIEGTRTLTDDEIAEKKGALLELDNQCKDIKTDNDKDIAKRDWLNRDSELTKGKNDAADALRIANEALECDDFKEKEQRVKDWSATIDARLWMTEVNKATNAQKEHKKILGELADTYSELLGGQKFAENEVSKIDAEIKEIDTFISTETDKVGVYENAQTIVGYLNIVHEGREAVRKNQTNIESENKNLADVLKPAYDKAKEEALSAKTAFEKEETLVKSQEETVANLNLPELREKRETAKDLLGKIASAKEHIETLELVKSQCEEQRKRLTERKNALDEKKKQSLTMDAPIHDAKIEMETCRTNLDKQKDTINGFASTLRLKLQVGDTCPICRQKIESALPHEEVLAALVDGLQSAFDDAKKKYDDLANQKVNLDAEINTEFKAYEHDCKIFEEDKSVANAEQKALTACRECGIVALDDSTRASLTSLAESTTNSYNALDVKVKEGETLETKAKELRSKLEIGRKGVETLAAKVSEAEKAMNECNGRIKTAEALVKTKNDEVRNAIENASRMISGKWTIDWLEYPKDFAAALTTLTMEYNGRVQRKRSLTGTLETARVNVENVKNVLTTILMAMPAWSEIESSDAAKKDNLLTKVNALNTSVATALNSLKSAEDSLANNRTNLTGFLADHPELSMERLEALNVYTSSNITRESDCLKDARENVVAKKTLFDNAEKLIAEHQTKKPEFAEEDTLNALNERIESRSKQLTEIDEKKGAINQELKTDSENRERLGILVEDADKKKGVYQKWSRMNMLIGDATGNKFRMIAQSYVLTSLIHSANSYMRTLTDRYTLKVTPGTFVITIEDAYQGFVSRAASTISGGESFLVSLSLALALSDIGQTLSVDTLFIDEGFGTLSGEPLQNAINTLRSLHTKAGRHVGIISHVEELQERIPVQIQVIQEGNHSSSRVNVYARN